MSELKEGIDGKGHKIDPDFMAQNNLAKIAIEYPFMPREMREEFEFSIDGYQKIRVKANLK